MKKNLEQEAREIFNDYSIYQDGEDIEGNPLFVSSDDEFFEAIYIDGEFERVDDDGDDEFDDDGEN